MWALGGYSGRRSSLVLLVRVRDRAGRRGRLGVVEAPGGGWVVDSQIDTARN